jgi:hypothetical protein
MLGDWFEATVVEMYQMEGYWLIRSQLTSKYPQYTTTGDILSILVENYIADLNSIGNPLVLSFPE